MKLTEKLLKSKSSRRLQISRAQLLQAVDGTMTVAEIPIIDFSPFQKDEGVVVNDPPTKGQLQVAKEIDAACRLHGFLFLANFGLEDEEREKTFQASADLFDLDESHKVSVLKRIKPEDNTGYAPMRSESLNRSRPPEMKEAFNIRFPPAHKNDLRGCPDSFVEASQTLLNVMRKAAQRYSLACALALGLPVDFFSSALEEFNLCTIRFLHAPPCDFDSTSEELGMPVRVGEHTDFGAFTFLLLGENGAEGLQIKPVEGGEIGGSAGLEEGDWQDVVVPKDTKGAIINTGSLMARWTGDVWNATAHRVIVSSSEMASRDRYSIAFFVDPDEHSIVDTHKDLLGDGMVKKYEAISSSDYLSFKLREMMNVDSKE